MLRTIMKLYGNIPNSMLKGFFDDYPCDSITYGKDEFNYSTITMLDKDNAQYFSTDFLDIIRRRFKVDEIEITITYEENSK